MEERVAMSHRDLDRLHILQKVQAKEITQIDASRMLDISERQVRRLIGRLNDEGSRGIVSKLLGKPGNRCLDPDLKQRVLALLREKYEGFGPTLASEKLLELDGIKVSIETIRQWMIHYSLWTPKKQKRNVHLPRLRRPCFGELIQADGSIHHWFGEEMPKANATVLIDDATSAITGLYFTKTESLNGYFEALKQHLSNYGRPVALYTDHWSSFGTRKTTNVTQMRRALKLLNTELILAPTPQAKGRVERANQTLQDRLVKEMRLRGIKTIEQANEYSREFMEKYNEKFSKKPMSDCNAHRPLEGYDLERVLSRHEERSLNSSAMFQFNSVLYQVQEVSEYRRMNKRKVEIRVTPSGKMRVFLGDRELKVVPYNQVIEKPMELSRKEVLAWKTKGHKVPITHPWKADLRRKMFINR
ncbi:MAG: ISNCY family transposase [Chlamydiales bacterium]|nr:ISNCY family transposase [Chlamydiales bacterium]